MGAARYIGRVGGLAVALGVGAAVLTGTAVAWADDGDAGASSGSSESAGGSGTESAGGSGATQSGTTTSSDTGGTAAADPGPSATKRSHQAMRTKAADASDASAADIDVDAADGTVPSTSRKAATRAKRDKLKRTDADADSPPAVAQNTPAVAPSTPNPSPAAEPGRAEPDSTPTEPVAAPVSLRIVAPMAAPADSTADEPVTPADADSGVGAEALLGAARRERSSQIAYAPTIDVDNGVITGTNNGTITSPANLELTFTVVGKTAAGGKVTMDKTTGNFSFLPYTTTAAPSGTDSFKVLVAEKTLFVDLLDKIPVVGTLAQPILVVLHRIPIVNVLLSPIIGRSWTEQIGIDVGGLAADYGAPIAFTTTVVSFDGTPISVNYFPADNLADGQTAPTILNGPSLATAGYTDPNQVTTVFGLVPGLQPLRAAGYNVITWDPRGEYASGGRLHLDSEDFEARDVSAIIDWMSGLPSTRYGPGPGSSIDPLLGMVGGSYGGGIQLTTAGIDNRVDAIAPGIAWNTLNEALYPNDAFKTSWAALLLLSLVVSGSRLDPEIYSGIATGVLFGFLTPRQQDFLSRNSPATVVQNITVPTLFLQGTVDTLFPLDQAIANASAINPAVPVKMIWYCGGHGQCLTMTQDELDAQTDFLVDQTLDWMNTYVAGKQPGTPPPVDGPKFEWVDQKGDWYTSPNLPVNPDVFNGPAIPVTGHGGVLPIVPILGGSGPQWEAKFPVSLTAGAKSKHALDIPVPTVAQTTYIVGAPTLSFTYSGLGTSRSVYAQLVDDKTGLVLGNIVSPVPVVLNGRTNTATVSMENIAFTMNPGDTLTLQIIDSATSFEDFTAFGVISIGDVALSLPTAAAVQPAAEPVPANLAAAV